MTLQYDGASSAPVADPNAVVDAAQVTGGAIPTLQVIGDARPDYVDLNAYLANFDADADPDGWRATVMLLDSMECPVIMHAHANFELIIRESTDYQLLPTAFC